MNQNISDLIDRIKALEEELEQEFANGARNSTSSSKTSASALRKK